MGMYLPSWGGCQTQEARRQGVDKSSFPEITLFPGGGASQAIITAQFRPACVGSTLRNELVLPHAGTPKQLVTKLPPLPANRATPLAQLLGTRPHASGTTVTCPDASHLTVQGVSFSFSVVSVMDSTIPNRPVASVFRVLTIACQMASRGPFPAFGCWWTVDAGRGRYVASVTACGADSTGKNPRWWTAQDAYRKPCIPL